MLTDLSESGKTLDGDHSIREENKKNSDWPWKRARKAAVMISFSGKDHLGMQRYVLQSLILLIMLWSCHLNIYFFPTNV